jgi:uncharacterized protein
MDLAKNPFSPGVPSDPKGFVGRDVLIRRLEAAIFNTRRQALVSVVGQRRIGKTSLLRKLEAKWNEEGQALCLFFDCQAFASRSAEDWLREIILTLSRESARDQQDQFPGLWDELAWRVAASEKRIILMLDEFDALAGSHVRGFDAAFFQRLRVLLVSTEVADKLTLIVATRESLADYSWAPQVVGSPFINITGKFVTVEFLAPRDAKALLARCGGLLTNDEYEVLLRLAGPHPYFLQIAGSEAWYLKREAEEIRSEEEGASSVGDPEADFEPQLRRRFREQAEMVYGQILGELLEPLRDDLYARVVLGTGDLRCERELRHRLILDEQGRPFSEGLRAFCVSRDADLREALDRRFRQLPPTTRDLLRKAAANGDAVAGASGVLLRQLGWLGSDGRVPEEVRLWIAFP